MDIQPLYGIPALRVDNIAVVGDLHIGMETHLAGKGFHISSRTQEMCDEMISFPDDISRLIVLGDVKDSVPGSTRQEYREIPEFFEHLLERFDIINVVRGNHDTNVEEFLPSRVRIEPASGFVAGDAGFIHGHTWPSDKVMSCDTLVTAHNHPTVMFMDGIGRTTTEQCWVRGKFSGNGKYAHTPDQFVIIPAFNRMLGGSPVNVHGTQLLGPLMNSDIVDIDSAGIYLLDGVYLGSRASMMIDMKRMK